MSVAALVDWPVVRSAEEEHTALFGALNNVAGLRDVVLGRLALFADDQLLQMWQYAREWGAAAWLIQCAICSEEKRRAQPQSGGRGKTDAAGIGVKAAMARRAAEMGVTPRTVLRYAQVYETFFARQTGGDVATSFMPLTSVLDDVSFWLEALPAPDPHAAALLMTDRKGANGFYTCRDAREDVGRLAWEDKQRRQAAAPDHPVPARGQFPIIYADPPWRYEDGTTSPNRFIENHYPTMDLDAICALPVAQWAAPDALLFLWATNPKLEEALRVMRAWDFTYRTNIVWVKDKIGLGHWVRQQHEILLIGRRGTFPTPEEALRPPSVLEAPRGVHSAKPEEVYDTIEAMYPGLSYLELFARGSRPGWQAWGLEAEAPTP